MASPDEDIAAKLDTELASLTIGTNLFTGPMRPTSSMVPQRCVFMYCLPGGNIMNYCNGGARTPQLYLSTVRVVARSNASGYDDGRDLARSIRDAIHDNPPSGYIMTRIRNSEPDYHGVDDTGSHIFSYDIDVMYSA